MYETKIINCYAIQLLFSFSWILSDYPALFVPQLPCFQCGLSSFDCWQTYLRTESEWLVPPCGRARQRRQAGHCLALLLPSLTGPRCIEPSSTTSTHRHHPAADFRLHHNTQRGLTSHFLPRNWIFLGTHKYFWCPDTNIFAAPGVVCGSQPCGAGVQCCSKFFVWDINWILTFLPWYRYWGWGGRCPLHRTMNLGFGRVFLTLLPSFYRIFPFYINWE